MLKIILLLAAAGCLVIPVAGFTATLYSRMLPSRNPNEDMECRIIGLLAGLAVFLVIAAIVLQGVTK